MTEPRKLFIRTFGCQMNEYDSARISDLLGRSHGMVLTDDAEEADVLLLNTCSVREKAQEKVEAHNFELRKNVVKFDDVMNDQRKVIYEQRLELMDVEEVQETVTGMRHEVIETLVARHIPEKAYPEQWDVEGLHERVNEVFNLDLPVKDWAQEEGIADEEIAEAAAWLHSRGDGDRVLLHAARPHGDLHVQR